MILIDALYINNSGGKVLLDYLVEELDKTKLDVFYLFDLRLTGSIDNIPEKRKVFLKASTKNRRKFYKENKNQFSKVFCFGNIPPPIKLSVPTLTYFHNVSLLEQPSKYGLKERITKRLKKAYIFRLRKHTDKFIVQTESVKTLVMMHFKVSNENCLIMPFYKLKSAGKNTEKHSNSFVYISNGNTHKNHLKLIQSWYLLKEKGYSAELNLTLTDNYASLIKIMNTAVNDGLNIINHGYVDPEFLYKKCKFQIYPSLCESFGLGLIEAVEFNCSVIASDLPFVYDVVIPSAVFNPHDSVSIANTVINVLEANNLTQSELKVSNQINLLLDLLIQ